MNKAYIWLIAGILILGIGETINITHDRAADTGYAVTATVTKVKYRAKRDVDGGPDWDEYIAYGTYTADGKSYDNVRLGTYATEISEGDKVTVTVDPQDPAKVVSDGMLLIVPGFIIVIISIAALIKSKKKSQSKQEYQNNQSEVSQAACNQIMQCAYCGTEIEIHDKYCPKCGKEQRS